MSLSGLIPTSDRRSIITGVLRLVDIIVVIGAGLFALWLAELDLEAANKYLIAVLLGGLLAANFLATAGLYVFERLGSLVNQVGRIGVGWGSVALALVSIAYLTKTSDQFSRFWSLAWLFSTFAGLILVRILLAIQLAHWRYLGHLTVDIAIVGIGEAARHVLKQLRGRDSMGTRVIGVFASDDSEPGRVVEGLPVLGSVDDLIALTRTTKVDSIIVALPWKPVDQLRQVLAKLQSVAVDVRLVPETFDLDLPPRGYTSLLNVYIRPLPGWSLLVKELEDKVLGSLLMLCALPIMALIALAIKLDSPGPVLFRQKRYGFNNDEFTVFKFRTMYQESGDAVEVTQAKRNDPRVTRVGRFLRRTSIDELPQLFNVLRGDMSLVGPRPHAVAHNEHYSHVIAGYLARHRVKPGITGWAQINGLRGATETPEQMRERVAYDLHYIDNWSLLFDLKILIHTVLFSMVNRNAY
ncbi:MAG: undecaprenyl-phosphate glucose phosphotransferase [Alphaproteobacteria bacterium]|nr:undecaprenyl-phosphate glucose phosphotransferase [Alphaproteobacteria bacterium]